MRLSLITNDYCPPPLSLSPLFWFSFAALFGNNENKTHVSLICCGIWATPTGLRGATAHAVTRKKSFECSPGQPSLPALRLDWPCSQTGSRQRGVRRVGSREGGGGGLQSQLKSHEIMAITLSSHLFLWAHELWIIVATTTVTTIAAARRTVSWHCSH